MSAPNTHSKILEPPTSRMLQNPVVLEQFLRTIWNRLGGYKSNNPNLTGLEASVPELNTLVGIDTRYNNTVQKQLNLKANLSALGTMSTQNSGSVIITGGNVSGVDITDSNIEIEAGKSDNFIKIGGSLDVDTVELGNGAGIETNLITYSMLGNTLSGNGSFLEIIAYGTIAANANNKEIKLKFGSSALYASGSVAANSGSWMLNARIIRIDGTNQSCITSMSSDNALILNDSNYTGATEDLSTGLDILCTGNGIAANDIIQKGLIVKYFNF